MKRLKHLWWCFLDWFFPLYMSWGYNEAVKDAFAETQRKSGRSSPFEVIRSALALYDLLIESKMQGEKIFLRDKQGFLKELDLFPPSGPDDESIPGKRRELENGITHRITAALPRELYHNYFLLQQKAEYNRISLLRTALAVYSGIIEAIIDDGCTLCTEDTMGNIEEIHPIKSLK